MNVEKNDKGVMVSQEPVAGVILMTKIALNEMVGLMHTIIRMGNPEDHVHVVYFEDEGVGALLIEPSEIFAGRDNDIKEEAMAEAINSQVETLDFKGSYAAYWITSDANTAGYLPTENLHCRFIDDKRNKIKNVRVYLRESKKRDREILKVSLRYK